MRWSALFAGVVLMAGSLAAQSPPSPSSLDWNALADLLVRQMALRPGEKVLLVAHPGEFEELRPLLRRRVMAAGAVDLGCWEVLPWERNPGNPGNVAALRAGNEKSREALRSRLRDVDVAVMMPGAMPSHPEYGAMQDVLNEGRGRTIHFHWHGGGAPSAVPVPGHPLPPKPEVDAFYQRALLQTDYAALAAVQSRFEAALRKGEVRVTSPAGTDLRFRIGERPVTRQDGDASAARAAKARNLIDREVELPAGVIRVAPLEESVEGTIAFPPGLWNEKKVEGLKLHFSRGQVTRIEATTGSEAVEAELQEAGKGARSFREMALGFNPELAIPEGHPWIPYYGYGAGVVRLSLGNNTELGGKVGGDYVRWNFFTDTTVTVDGQVWVRDGKLVAP